MLLGRAARRLDWWRGTVTIGGEQTDPYARGAYSYAPAGAIGASACMTDPVDDTLYFAGEHTDTSGHWGTVHGALRSGPHVATQLLRVN